MSTQPQPCLIFPDAPAGFGAGFDTVSAATIPAPMPLPVEAKYTALPDFGPGSTTSTNRLPVQGDKGKCPLCRRKVYSDMIYKGGAGYRQVHVCEGWGHDLCSYYVLANSADALNVQLIATMRAAGVDPRIDGEEGMP